MNVDELYKSNKLNILCTMIFSILIKTFNKNISFLLFKIICKVCHHLVNVFN